MKILTLKNILFCSVASIIIAQKIHSQTNQVSVSQNPKFEELLNEKRKINASITINDRFKIQIFNGDAETAKSTLIDFKKNNKNLDGTVVFNTPIYKVWVGNFKTRIEAEKVLGELKKKYPIAFLIKPNKQQ